MFKAYYNLLLPESNNVENSSYTDSTLLSSTDLSSFALAYDITAVVVVCFYAPTHCSKINTDFYGTGFEIWTGFVFFICNYRLK